MSTHPQYCQHQGPIHPGGNAYGTIHPSQIPKTPGASQAPPPPYSEGIPSGALNAIPSGSSFSPIPHPPHSHAIHTQGPSYPHPHTVNHAIPPNHYQAPGGPQAPPMPIPHAHAHMPHAHFGPTPLNDQQMLLPYAFYTERAVVDARARWRFCEAVLCALGIYLGVALLVGVEGYGDGWWAFGRGVRAGGGAQYASI